MILLRREPRRLREQKIGGTWLNFEDQNDALQETPNK